MPRASAVFDGKLDSYIQKQTVNFPSLLFSRCFLIDHSWKHGVYFCLNPAESAGINVRCQRSEGKRLSQQGFPLKNIFLVLPPAVGRQVPPILLLFETLGVSLSQHWNYKNAIRLFIYTIPSKMHYIYILQKQLDSINNRS